MSSVFFAILQVQNLDLPLVSKSKLIVFAQKSILNSQSKKFCTQKFLWFPIYFYVFERLKRERETDSNCNTGNTLTRLKSEPRTPSGFPKWVARMQMLNHHLCAPGAHTSRNWTGRYTGIWTLAAYKGGMPLSLPESVLTSRPNACSYFMLWCNWLFPKIS